jgi:hypothetical protein
MSFFNQFWRKPGNPRLDHEKAWKRSQATSWDEKWQALSNQARHVYLNTLKPPAKSMTAPNYGTLLDKLPEAAVSELVEAGFAKVEPGSGRRGSKLFALPATHDFSMRLRAIQRAKLLNLTDRSLLTNYVKFAFQNQGESVVLQVLEAAKVEEFSRIDEAIELYVTSSQWPEWALNAINTKPSAAVLEAIRKAKGPVKLADLPGLVQGLKPKEIQEALTDLVSYLAVFEDLQPETLEIIVGLLSSVRDSEQLLAKANQPSPLIVCKQPKEIGPLGGLAINDLRVFLLEVAGEAPRLKQDGSLFAKEEPRFYSAFPPVPLWLENLLKIETERRLYQAYSHARSLGFTEAEREDKAGWLKLSARGKKWLSSGLEEQYGKFYESFRELDTGLVFKDLDNEFDDDDDCDDGYGYGSRYGYSRSYNQHHGDSQFYGVSVSVHRIEGKNPRHYSYYSTMSDEVRKALRDSVLKAFDTLPIGVYHRWESVVAHLTSQKTNPLNLGTDPSKLILFVNQRQIPRLPEAMLQATRLFLETFLLQRLLPFDAFRPAIDNEGKLCVARLPRFDGYFGKTYDPGKDEISASTKVIVQPDFSVLVIGLDPAPAVELAPFCDRSGGHAGQGALTFKITRESVVRAALQGLNAQAILTRLKKYASIEIPTNVHREINEWASWVRQVNVRPVTVIRCADSATVDRVLAVLGKKAERLGQTMAALHTPKLGSAEKQKLQDQGILITKQDIEITPPSPNQPAPTPPKISETSKKRGRPKKVR